LTAAQGGRASGPPPTPEDQDYTATAYVPPATVDDGLASFVLRVMDRSAWRRRAPALRHGREIDDAAGVG
jgi:hypothetical protein